MSTQSQPILISLKPCYAELVFEGLKTAELRRRIPRYIENRDVYIYVSSPVMELRGGFRVGHIWSGSPDEIWSTVSGLAGVSREAFDDYYEGKKVAFALEILKVWKFKDPVSLETLRNRFPYFVVPQSYRYLKPHEQRAFRNLKRLQSGAVRHLAS